MIRKLNKHEEIPYQLLLLADETKEGIDTYIHHSEIYIYEYNSEALGCYALELKSSSVAEVMNIAVQEQQRGKGIGTALLEHAITIARECGCEEIHIGTGDIATKQIALYKKVGFEVYQVKTDFFVEKYEEPIFENGMQLRDMVMLKKALV